MINLTNNSRRLIVIIILVLLISQLSLSSLQAESEPGLSREEAEERNLELVEEQLSRLDLSKLQEQIDKLNRETGDYVPDLALNDLIGFFTEEELGFDLSSILGGLLRYLFREVVVNFELLGKLIILAVIGAVLKTFQNSFAQQDISRLVDKVVYLVLVIIALNSFRVAIGVAQQAINDMTSVMYALLPILLTLLVTLGNLTSVAIFQPLTFMMVSLLSTLIESIIFPSILFVAVLSLVDNISDNFNVSGLAKLIKEINLGLLGAASTIFIGVLAIQGTAGAVGDGITIRTIKYLSGAFVPVIGGFFADTLDTVIGGSLLIKNALGVLGVIVIFLFCAFSVIKIVALIFIYRFARAVIEPISDSKIVICLDQLGNHLLLVFAAVFVVALMFFIMLTILIGVGNMTVMLR
ncbi:stage III sporulation protein AE [Fuchsiella alkaliacetigena]|uniref:stage III sporulation protein AE n=1 Tax=Fuchsiella alkaliacetigena TaxID=957042 RepID=UPI00200B51A2|nr:stage III sporulation protein AE [Fuchsiella alkaliacetigena]MCK8825456.1 stage III sporulation protein AE [Fuchsiella alkaliacetigena]